MPNRLKLHFIVDMESDAWDFSPHLGVGYLSAYLKKRLPGVQTSLSLLSDDIPGDIARRRPDLVALSCTSRYYARFRDLTGTIRDRFGLPVLWGGVHLSFSPRDLPEGAAAGAVGEGEETLFEMLDRFDGGRFLGLDGIRGAVYREDGRIVENGRRPLIEPLDALPWPDHDLLRVRWGPKRRAVMITSRGCPLKCRFCASSKFWDRTRLHSPGYVVGEIRMLVERFGVREILIFDDFFTINRARTAAIAEAVRDDPRLRGLKFECLSRVDAFDETAADALKEMGVYRVSFGIESGSRRTLEYLNKGSQTPDLAADRVRLAKSRGFQVVGSFIIGSPGETEEDIEETLAFIARLDLDNVQVTVATPFPGTGLWEDGKRLGRITGDAWSDDYYALFANEPGIPLPDLLRGKVLMTTIERERFLELAAQASRLCDRINMSGRNMARGFVRMVRDNPRHIPASMIRCLRHLSSGR